MEAGLGEFMRLGQSRLPHASWPCSNRTCTWLLGAHGDSDFTVDA